MAAETNAQDAKKPSPVVTLAILAALSLVAAGGGWFFGGIVAPSEAGVEKSAKADADTEHAEGEEGAAQGDPRIFDLDPITTNLGYPSDSWVRLDVALLFDEQPDEALAQTVHQDILAYLRTVSLQQIEGPRGFQHLRSDLVERVKLRSEGKISNLLFRTFVIE